MALKSHFKFNKEERNGIFFLLLLIFIFQGVYFYVRSQPADQYSSLILNEVAQSQLDSLKANVPRDTQRIFPFNPNYLTDYRGYVLGMSPEEIDRLLEFRKKKRYVNSAEEFQRVTKVSDSLLANIKPYMKFPKRLKGSNGKSKEAPTKTNVSSIPKKDINLVTAEELKTIKGIGEVLSNRIIKFRNRLGGFLNKNQLNDVYGLKPDVVTLVWEKFDVVSISTVNKINVNSASAAQLAKLVYIDYKLAQRIVAFREANGPFNSLEQLIHVEDFPRERIERIKLYLQL